MLKNENISGCVIWCWRLFDGGWGMLLSQSIDILDEAGRRVFLGWIEGSFVFLGGGIAIFNNFRMDISSLVYILC